MYQKFGVIMTLKHILSMRTYFSLPQYQHTSFRHLTSNSSTHNPQLLEIRRAQSRHRILANRRRETSTRNLRRASGALASPNIIERLGIRRLAIQPRIQESKRRQAIRDPITVQQGHNCRECWARRAGAGLWDNSTFFDGDKVDALGGDIGICATRGIEVLGIGGVGVFCEIGIDYYILVG
jgi:hypothetical protein